MGLAARADEVENDVAYRRDTSFGYRGVTSLMRHGDENDKLNGAIVSV
jgi:hypothetical protein